MEITDNMFTNLIFLIIIAGFSFYSYKKNKKQEGTVFALIGVIYLIYILRKWFR